MLRRRQKEIEQTLLRPLAVDAVPPFASPWVFGRQRQEALTDMVYGQLTEEKSLVLFYTKEGHPFGDGIRRLVVGIGCITKVGKREHYDTVDNKQGYPLWDRVISHSIRPEGVEGFLLPYHEYLATTGNQKEDELRAELVREVIIVTPPAAHQGDFSYGSEITDADVVLSVLSRALAALRKIRDHGFVKGPWQKREEWLNKQINLAWKDRGAFPGVGPMLEALGMRLGTALVLELRGSGVLKPESDPWPVLDEIFQGKQKAPDQAFDPDIQSVAPTWLGLPPERRKLMLLLSRFDLTAAQAKRVWEESRRRAAFTRPTSDQEIIANPYLIAERDLGGGEDSTVSLELIDRGLLPDESLAAAPKLPEPSRVDSAADRRRTRCALVTVLQEAAEAGDTLLSMEEALGRLPALSAAHPILIPADWIEGNVQFLEGVISRLTLEVNSDPPKHVPALQLSEVKSREEKLAKILRARCGKEIESPKADWKKLIVEAIEANGQNINLKNTRHSQGFDRTGGSLGGNLLTPTFRFNRWRRHR